MTTNHCFMPTYVIGARYVKDMRGNELPFRHQCSIYVLKEPYNGLGSTVLKARTFCSVEEAMEWWNDNKVRFMDDIIAVCDPSTLKIRKRIMKVVEEDIENINLAITNEQ